MGSKAKVVPDEPHPLEAARVCVHIKGNKHENGSGNDKEWWMWGENEATIS